MKLGEKAINRLNKKVPPMKPKLENAVKNAVKKVKSSVSGATHVDTPKSLGKVSQNSVGGATHVDTSAGVGKVSTTQVGGGASLERSPKADTYISISQSQKPKRSSGIRLGDIFVEKNRKLAEKYKKDLVSVAQEIPEATFIPEYNFSSTKELPSILDKLAKRDKEFIERGFNGVVRDGVRATLFLPNADKNYGRVVDVMEKKRYKISDTFAEDANGNIILDAAGCPKMKPDIDIRFGDNAVASGYEDVQMRFEKGGKLYELIILPGPNYAACKNLEHTQFYESLRQYDKLNKDLGTKQIIKGLKKEFGKLTQRLYKQALARDLTGSAAASEPITFSQKNIDEINELFKALKTLYRGKYNELPPSKRIHAFKDTQAFKLLDKLEKALREVMEMYKPID